MSYRLIDANALNGAIFNDDYEKVLNAPCIFVDLPNGLDGKYYNLYESVLDKIRAEIRKKMRFNAFNEGIISFGDVSKILDKYKAENGGMIIEEDTSIFSQSNKTY